MTPTGVARSKGASRADPELGKSRNVWWTNASEPCLWARGCHHRKASLDYVSTLYLALTGWCHMGGGIGSDQEKRTWPSRE